MIYVIEKLLLNIKYFPQGGFEPPQADPENISGEIY